MNAAIKRVEHGFSTAEEEAAKMTGGSYSANIKQRKIEAAQKREVDEITDPQIKTGGEGNV